MEQFGLTELTKEESININGGSVLASIILGIIIGGGVGIVIHAVNEMINGSDCECE